MAANKLFGKDPNAVLDYAIDWSSWLGTDTISTSAWTVASGITKTGESKTSTKATIWLSGGTAGVTYELTNRIVTTAGRTDDRTIGIVVGEK